jgi:hypothetical protein
VNFERPSLPAFTEIPPPGGRCPYLGIGRNRIYALAQFDPNIIIQLGGRSVVDAHRILALIDAMPRGPRRPNGGGNRKGRKRRT